MIKLSKGSTTQQCKVQISREPPPSIQQQHTPLTQSQEEDQITFGMQDIEVYIQQRNTDSDIQQQACRVSLSQDSIFLSLEYPFKEGEQLSIIQMPSLQVAEEKPEQIIAESDKKPYQLFLIDLNSLDLANNQAQIQSQNINVYFEVIGIQLEENIDVSNDDPIQSERSYKLDLSATNLPLKANKFSFFQKTPLLSFYELISSTPADGSNPSVLFESDVSKIASCDPFWTLTHAIPHSQLSPCFTVNMYQSIDNEKSKRALVASVTVELESILGPEKETMFEVPGTDGKTVLMLDRIQIIEPTEEEKKPLESNLKQ